MLQVLNENKEVVSQEKAIIQGDSIIVIIRNLAPGKYAVQYYHDENLNGSLDKSRLGIPTEGYGFSNNAYGMFGPKPFRDWLFVFPENRSLSLEIKYH